MDEIEAVFRHVSREVWIVTSAAAGRRGGLTATWVARASLDPQTPAVLAGIAPSHFTAELIEVSGAFGLHLLGPQQGDLAFSFADGSGRNHDKFAGLETHAGETGSPILASCLAWLDCRVQARLTTGDRVYYWADVVAGGNPGDGSPLREAEFFAGLSPEQGKRLRADLEADLRRQRPARAAWREQLPAGLRPSTG